MKPFSMFTAAESISLFVVSDNDPHPYRQPWPVGRVPTAPHESLLPDFVVRYAGLEAFESDTLHIPFGSIWIPQKCSHSWMGQHFVNAEFCVLNLVIGARYFAPIFYWTDFRFVDGPDEMPISKCKINARDGRFAQLFGFSVWVLSRCQFMPLFIILVPCLGVSDLSCFSHKSFKSLCKMTGGLSPTSSKGTRTGSSATAGT